MHWYFNAQNPDKIRTLRKDRGNLLPVAFYARESKLKRAFKVKLYVMNFSYNLVIMNMV